MKVVAGFPLIMHTQIIDNSLVESLKVIVEVLANSRLKNQLELIIYDP